MSNDDDFDLYEDLDNACLQPPAEDVDRLKAEEIKLAAEKEYEEKLAAKDQRIAELESKIEDLETKSVSAEKNFSILCSTARSELAR